jgi:nucleoside-diphosphate-sugar epimerase
MNLSKQVIFEIIKIVKNEKVKEITLNGKINDSRQFIFIDDLVRIFLKLALNKKSFLLLNISNGKKFRIKDILSYVQKKMKVNKRIKYKNQSSPEFPILKNTQLLKELKNFKFENFYKSLDKTIDYWKN